MQPFIYRRFEFFIVEIYYELKKIVHYISAVYTDFNNKLNCKLYV